MTRRGVLLAALFIFLAAAGCAAISGARPPIVAKQLFEVSTEPRWKAGGMLTIDPRGECVLRADLARADREKLADYLARSVNGSRLMLWRSELDSIAEQASLWERLNVSLFGRADQLLNRANQRMKMLQALDDIPNLEQRLINCAA